MFLSTYWLNWRVCLWTSEEEEAYESIDVVDLDINVCVQENFENLIKIAISILQKYVVMNGYRLTARFYMSTNGMSANCCWKDATKDLKRLKLCGVLCIPQTSIKTSATHWHWFHLLYFIININISWDHFICRIGHCLDYLVALLNCHYYYFYYHFINIIFKNVEWRLFIHAHKL